MDYGNEKTKQSRLADFRNLLYFTTFESIKDEGTELSFYTSDESTEYTIIVEGIRSNGSLERVCLPLKVEDVGNED